MQAATYSQAKAAASPWWAWLPVLASALALAATAQGARRILDGSLDSHYFFGSDGNAATGVDFLQRWRVLWSDGLLLPGLAVTTLAVLFLTVLSRMDRTVELDRPTRLATCALASLGCLSAAAILAAVAFDLSQVAPPPLSAAAAVADPVATHVYPAASCVLLLAVLCGLAVRLLTNLPASTPATPPTDTATNNGPPNDQVQAATTPLEHAQRDSGVDMGVLCIVLRARVSKSASAVYKGTLLERLVLSQEKSKKWMIIVGVVVIALSLGIVISGFFIS